MSMAVKYLCLRPEKGAPLLFNIGLTKTAENSNPKGEEFTIILCKHNKNNRCLCKEKIDYLFDDSTTPKQIEAKSKVNDQIEAKSKVNDQIEATSKANDQIEAKSKVNDQIEATSKANEQIEAKSKVNEQIQTKSKVNEESNTSSSYSVAKSTGTDAKENKTVQAEPARTSRSNSESQTPLIKLVGKNVEIQAKRAIGNDIEQAEKDDPLSVIKIPVQDNLALTLPEIAPRYHGRGCTLEISILEHHDDNCEFKKNPNKNRHPIDDRCGSYEVVGRTVFKTCQND